MPQPEDIHIPLVRSVVVTPTPRLLELFLKPEPLTADEWAEIELYEAMQKEELDEYYQG